MGFYHAPAARALSAAVGPAGLTRPVALCALGLFLAGPELLWAETGYDRYTAWSDWARITFGSRVGLVSSYDRAGANQDYSQYESPPGLITTEIPCTSATLTGPGTVWLQSLPFSKLAGRIVGTFARGKGQGSVLGGMANIFEGR